LLGGVFTAMQPTESAGAGSASEFDPGYIIDDSEFYNRSALTEAEIQAFLERNGSGLATYKSAVSGRDANNHCHPFQGGANLLASTIIFRVQEACGISAKVVLVTLQKEQGLITTANPTASALRIAMGYG